MRWMNICYAMLFLCFQVSAQSGGRMAQAVNKVAEQIRDHYVDSARGAAIAANFREAYQKGVFKNVTLEKGFDSLATAVLRNYSHDGHLYVRIAPDAVAEMKEKKDTTGVDIFFYGPQAESNNFGFREVSVLPGNIGYIKLSQVNISKKSLPVLYAAMQLVARTRSLVIDLRNNGGGGSDIGAVFESCFLPAGLRLLTSTDRKGKAETDTTLNWPEIPHYQQPVYVLVNKKSVSAAEAFAFVLQAQHRATVVGEPSAGAANMNEWYPVNDELIVSVSIRQTALPGTSLTWEGKGVQPDILTPEAGALQYVLDKLK
ncbi:S41 family peptidase [Chitinophaga vietnamensis]|uniref:S41 family peptidase n=1 Tax=Chitinophaga vietnamensis TaxID=2593957 RepID=UPI00117860FA|nr:S41 family peptidase [Chitinophaga vietnamensis]